MNGFQLKLIALLLMTLDHFYSAASTFTHAPIIFTQLGRLSAPLFIFLTAQGMQHTRNRGKYIGRLYLASIAMEVGNLLINTWIPLPKNAIVVNNIFATLFVSTLIITTIDALIKGLDRSQRKQLIWASLGTVYIVTSTAFYSFAMSGMNQALLNISMFMPNPIAVEGSIIWVFLGVGFYFATKKKSNGTLKRIWTLPVFYLLFCAVVFYLTTGMILTFDNLFLVNFQWLMIGSLPLLMLYNGQKGKGWKWFFYVYYPLHIYLLTLWAHFMG